jgi:coenzyme F420 hydrogenase subunit beta
VKKRDFSLLQKRVIQRGLCTACGTCVGGCPTGAIQFDFDLEEPALKGSCSSCGICDAICPGEDIPLAQLEKAFLGETRSPANELLGVSRGFFKGFAKDREIRRSSASGGLTTALLLYVLDQKKIDGAIVTAMSPEKPWRTKPVLARTRQEVIEAARSKYTLCPNNIALREIGRMDRVAVVGLPCHIHGIRKLQSLKALSGLADRIVLTLGLLCGSNRRHEATEHLIQEYTDVNLEEVEHFEYRGGLNAQEIKIFSRDKKETTVPTTEWRVISQSMTKDRCRMCCDYSAELADLSLGDICDPRSSTKRIPNWNSLIVRTEKGQRLIKEAREAGIIEVFPLEEKSFYGNVGFEMKKHGAVYTLRERKRHGWPVPNYHYEFTWQARRKGLYSVPEE